VQYREIDGTEITGMVALRIGYRGYISFLVIHLMLLTVTLMEQVAYIPTRGVLEVMCILYLVLRCKHL